jgi:hypothetical protein
MRLFQKDQCHNRLERHPFFHPNLDANNSTTLATETCNQLKPFSSLVQSVLGTQGHLASFAVSNTYAKYTKSFKLLSPLST